MSSELKNRIDEEVKTAMRARDRQRLGILRLVMAELKKVEVDERIELDDQRVLAILDRMVKQRKDSLTQFQAAGRDDLVAQESFELDVLYSFLPARMTLTELQKTVHTVIEASGATSMKDMGKVMGQLKSIVQGRADMAEVGQMVKDTLGG